VKICDSSGFSKEASWVSSSWRTGRFLFVFIVEEEEEEEVEDETEADEEEEGIAKMAGLEGKGLKEKKEVRRRRYNGANRNSIRRGFQ
jgi:hypothetical protein